MSCRRQPVRPRSDDGDIGVVHDSSDPSLPVAQLPVGGLWHGHRALSENHCPNAIACLTVLTFTPAGASLRIQSTKLRSVAASTGRKAAMHWL
jgi:hypothetical protein